VAVRIRMKQMGRTHRHYYRIVAIDHRQPRDGKVIEELGSYDPHVANKDARVKLVPSRIKYWMSVGAKPSDHCQNLFDKFMKSAEEAEIKSAADAAVAKAAAAAEVPKA
jgi:small subunit ribosomal protein S16